MVSDQDVLFVIHEGKKLFMVTAEIWKVQSGEMPLLYSTDALQKGFSTLLVITGFQVLIHQNVSCFKILGIWPWMSRKKLLVKNTCSPFLWFVFKGRRNRSEDRVPRYAGTESCLADLGRAGG